MPRAIALSSGRSTRASVAPGARQRVASRARAHTGPSAKGAGDRGRASLRAMSTPAFPAAAPKRSRSRRFVMLGIGALALLVLVALLCAGAAFAHARATPDFRTYVKERRAGDELATPIRTE